MTLDGFCDHTAMTADDEIHQHYNELLSNAGTLIYGRITYQLMKYWKAVAENPTGEKVRDEFAMIMNKIPKIVFSHTHKNADWESAKQSPEPIENVRVLIAETIPTSMKILGVIFTILGAWMLILGIIHAINPNVFE